MNRSDVTRVFGCALAGLVLLPPLPAGAAPSPTPTAPAPQVQIAIDDGQPSAAVGQTLRYTVTVTNLGSASVADMLITQTVPAGTTVSPSAGTGPKPTRVTTAAGQSRLQWPVTVGPGKTVTRHSALTLTDAPETLLRLASVACLQAGAKAAPVVCASDSDLLPAGAAAAQSQPAAAPAAGASGVSPWWYAGGAAVVALLGAALLWWRRRQRPTTS